MNFEASSGAAFESAWPFASSTSSSVARANSREVASISALAGASPTAAEFASMSLNFAPRRTAKRADGHPEVSCQLPLVVDVQATPDPQKSVAPGLALFLLLPFTHSRRRRSLSNGGAGSTTDSGLSSRQRRYGYGSVRRASALSQVPRPPHRAATRERDRLRAITHRAARHATRRVAPVAPSAGAPARQPSPM